jgi:hypothetical protein
MLSERGREVGGHDDFARFGVELDVDVHRVAACDPGRLADLCAHAEHEPPAHRRDAAAIRVAIDRDANSGPLAPEARNDLGGNLDPCRGLPALLDARAESHALCGVGCMIRIALPNGSRSPQSIP